VSVCVMPESPKLALDQIGARGETAQEADLRKGLLWSEYTHLVDLAQSDSFDYVFVNEFDDASTERFLGLLSSVLDLLSGSV